jgi:hypothetical protein
MKGRVTSTALIVYLVASVVAGANPALACGWNLLFPPEVKTSAPFKTWQQLGAFDSAKECEVKKKEMSLSREEMIQKVQRGELVAIDPMDHQAWERLNTEFELWLLSVCVATDDPRLAK